MRGLQVEGRVSQFFAINGTFPELNSVFLSHVPIRSETSGTKNMTTWQRMLREIEKTTKTDGMTGEVTRPVPLQHVSKKWFQDLSFVLFASSFDFRSAIT
jgi:hypothetical protein